MNPHVALIIPCHNQSNYTSGILFHIHQFWDEAISHVVVIDDGSTDDTRDVLEKWTLKFRKERNCIFMVLKNQKGSGFAAAINQGIRYCFQNARISHLCLFNNDMVLRHRWLYWLLRTLEENPTIGMASSTQITPRDCSVGDYTGMTLPFDDPQGKPVFTLRFSANGLPWLIRRNAVELTGFFDEGFRVGWYEDIDYWVRMVRAGYEFCYVQNVPCFHFEHQTLARVKETILDPNDLWEGANAIRFRGKWGSEYPELPPLWGFKEEDHPEALRWGK